MASVWRHAHQNTIQSEVNVRSVIVVKSVYLMLVHLMFFALNVIIVKLHNILFVEIYVLLHIIKSDLRVPLVLIIFALFVMDP